MAKNFNVKKFFQLSLLLSSLVVLFVGCGGSSDNPSGEDIIAFFAFTGDLQIGYPEWQATKDTNPSSTNIPQLRQTVADLAAMNPRPDFFAILGDLVMAEGEDDGSSMKIQVDAWKTIYQSLEGSNKFRLITLPGNHELNYYSATKNDQAPYPIAYNVWLDWINDTNYNSFAGNGPKPKGSNPDKLVRDEDKLTYSHNLGSVHLVFINTDTLSEVTNPQTGLPVSGWIPINWIKADVEAAQANPHISDIIVLGHRPIDSPSFLGPEYGNTIINSADWPLADELAETLNANSKVRAYLGSHVHSFSAAPLTKAPRVLQVIAGNGGAPLEQNWTPAGGQYFGFSTLKVQANGKVTIGSYGRALPTPPQKFYEDTPEMPAPAQLLQEFEIN